MLSEALAAAIACDADVGFPTLDDRKIDQRARHVAILADGFTKNRDRPSGSYLQSEDLCRAYVAYYLPVTIAKIQSLLDELPIGWTDLSRPLNVVDVGSGPGAGALAVADWLQSRSSDAPPTIRVTAVDQAPRALECARRLWGDIIQDTKSPASRLITRVGRLESPDVFTADGRYDLIIVANVLDELFRWSRDPIDSRARLLESCLDRLTCEGTLMVLEPAQRETSRGLLAIRDRLLKAGACTVYSPCLHEHPCPALVKLTDWCHEERPWAAPQFVTAIDARVGFIKDALKFSYLLLRRDGRTIVPRSADVYRMVSELRVLKGEKRAWLCNEQGRPEVGRLDRHQTTANAAFDVAHRGAIVRISDIQRGERRGRPSTIGRISFDASVEIMRSEGPAS